ncbi:hypothetical protein [Alkalimarinus alittae]|uniref:Uncharacterized protein n=1 Tax=Alkalimarinus alittae TaxID=2961619 RepID=A0ABY6MXQ1_9ALTE|nr:hypothetical protein [Alkalimarinus alittae]UZE94606.1 hypothetical protein NKI27_10955 [Alkalimarinus alittae]
MTAIWDTTQLNAQIPDLTIRVKVRRGFLKSEWVDVKTFSLNNTHCIIKTDELFALDSKITISLSLSLEPTDLVIDSLTVTVKKQKKECSCFFYELELNSDAAKGATVIDSPINRMVELVNKKIKISNKVLVLSQAAL